LSGICSRRHFPHYRAARPPRSAKRLLFIKIDAMTTMPPATSGFPVAKRSAHHLWTWDSTAGFDAHAAALQGASCTVVLNPYMNLTNGPAASDLRDRSMGVVGAMHHDYSAGTLDVGSLTLEGWEASCVSAALPWS
jgi:hypothetical protein